MSELSKLNSELENVLLTDAFEILEWVGRNSFGDCDQLYCKSMFQEIDYSVHGTYRYFYDLVSFGVFDSADYEVKPLLDDEILKDFENSDWDKIDLVSYLEIKHNKLYTKLYSEYRNAEAEDYKEQMIWLLENEIGNLNY